MKKNIVQDVIPPKKSIRNIEISSKYKPAPETVVSPKPSKSVPKTEKEIPSYKYEYDEPKKPSRRILYISLSFFIVALAFGISALFKSAKISVTPRQESVTLNENLTAVKDASVGLGFQVVTTTKNLEKTVEGTSDQKVEIKARGRIVVYNTTSQAQKLVATTRFSTPEGLIYRAVEAVNIPGSQIKNGKSVAGNVDVVVEADKSGSEYNIGLKDFTIPGFKGTPKYTQIYARSKTEMSGGFSGMQKVVSPEVMAQAEKDLDAELRVSLARDIQSQIPENFVLYSDSFSYKFEPVAQVTPSSSGTGANKASLQKKGTIRAIIFDKGSLTRAIVAKVLPKSVDDTVKMTNLADLNFSYASSSIFDPNTSNTVSFKLTGQPNFVWVFDENKLKTDLLGLSKKNANTIIATYGNIKEAWVETYPFWNSTIPGDPKKVTLVNTLAK